jgi:fused signal recognition particle receptor
MLKFWKKKPSSPGPVDGLPLPATSATDDDITEEVAFEAAADADAEEDPEITLEHAHPADTARSSQTSSEPAARPRSWRERLAGSAFARNLGGLFARNPKLDDDLLDELETCLITADVGIAAATEIVEQLRKRVAKREFADADALLGALRTQLVNLLQAVEKPLDVGTHSPFVVLMVGVNGVGKTTTIGKLAHRFLKQKHSLMLAAGDTFRAAAVEQLQTWGQRNNVPVIAQASGADSASVIFDALQAARSRRIQVLIADTAGRLHTQTGLMDELSKIRRVLGETGCFGTA